MLAVNGLVETVLRLLSDLKSVLIKVEIERLGVNEGCGVEETLGVEGRSDGWTKIPPVPERRTFFSS